MKRASRDGTGIAAAPRAVELLSRRFRTAQIIISIVRSPAPLVRVQGRRW